MTTQVVVSIDCFQREALRARRAAAELNYLYVDGARRGAEFSRKIEMKSAYELAMERLEKSQPSVALTSEQKQQIAEIDSSYKAKIAEKELLLRDEIRKAQATGNFEEADKIEQQLASEIKRLRDDCEAAKEKLRSAFKAS